MTGPIRQHRECKERQVKLKNGIYAAQLVPYADDGKVMERELAAMIDRNIVLGKLDGLYIGGSTGENFLNDNVAKRRVLEIAADTAKGRVSLIAQIGSLDLREAEGLARLAAKLGYDAVSAVTPFYYKFTFPEIKEYYIKLAEAAGLPMIVYIIPALTGTSIDVEQSKKLFEHPLVAGFKYTSGDLFTMERILRTYPDRILFSGYDELILCGRALGAYGAIGSTYNVFAGLARRIWDAVGSGNLAEARDRQADLNGAIQALASIGLFQALKEIIAMDGIATGRCLSPMAPLTDEGRAKVRAIAQDLVKRGVLELGYKGGK
jgi:N-acetylneuraminate lyase